MIYGKIDTEKEKIAGELVFKSIMHASIKIPFFFDQQPYQVNVIKDLLKDQNKRVVHRHSVAFYLKNWKKKLIKKLM